MTVHLAKNGERVTLEGRNVASSSKRLREVVEGMWELLDLPLLYGVTGPPDPSEWRMARHLVEVHGFILLSDYPGNLYKSGDRR